jgi:multiple sugar transport system ATP-binding protein
VVAGVVLERVSKVYVDGTTAVDDLSLTVHDGEFLVLVGPSGCGKTTALRMIAGLEEVSAGTLRIGERVVNQVPARDRDLAMVFQSYALYPHLDVRNNIGFGLRLRKVPRPELDHRVESVADALGLKGFLDRRPASLSGGQRQRVAMGRAIVREPAAFLMDEPLSNLDARLRVRMRAEIARTARRLGVTTIYVTHDQTEAMTLGHRVAVLRHGVLQQVAEPQELYDNPANLFVAGFLGSPAMNLVQGTFMAGPRGLGLVLGEHRLAVPDPLLHMRSGLGGYLNRPVAVGIRPEDLSDARGTPPAGDTVLHGIADLVETLGSDLLVHIRLPVAPVVTGDNGTLGRDAGTDLVGRFSPRSRIRAGDPVQVRVDVNRLHVFDLDTGRAIR